MTTTSEIRSYVQSKTAELNAAKQYRLARSYDTIESMITRAELTGGIEELHARLLDQISEGNSQPGSNLHTAVTDVLSKFFQEA
jgi:hypothetical protein